jgi:hypothetical protein
VFKPKFLFEGKHFHIGIKLASSQFLKNLRTWFCLCEGFAFNPQKLHHEGKMNVEKMQSSANHKYIIEGEVEKEKQKAWILLVIFFWLCILQTYILWSVIIWEILDLKQRPWELSGWRERMTTGSLQLQFCPALWKPWVSVPIEKLFYDWWTSSGQEISNFQSQFSLLVWI